MEQHHAKQLHRFIHIGRAEAFSFILLIFIAMPLKYLADIPQVVTYLGWIHGILFMAYLAQLVLVAYLLKWEILWVIYGSVAALLPFGPFVFERKILR